MSASRPSPLPTPEICPVCGELVPRHALACPGCGADHRSGWREDAEDDGGFEYDDYIQREFGAPPVGPSGIKPFWWITALVLLVVFGWIFLRGLFLF